MKPKKLVYISKYLELPTKKYFGGRGYHLIKLMSDFETHIITSNSNHLTDVSNDLQEKKNISIIKINSFDSAKSFSRIISWFLFEFKLFFKLLLLPRADVYVCSSLSLFTILNGIIFKKIFKAKLVFEIRDIWPLTLTEEGGFSENNFYIKIMGLIEKIGYQSSDLIIGTMPNLDKHVKAITSKHPKIITIPMGYSDLQLNSGKSNINFSSDNNKIKICYSGTFGITNNILHILDFVSFCKAQNLPFEFYFLGDGKYLDKIKNDKNVNYLGKIDRYKVIDALSNFDCLIFSTHPSNVWHFGQSLNKLIDYMLANKPILGFYNGYESMLNECISGKFIDHNDYHRAIDFIKKCKSLEVNSRDWIIQNRSFQLLSSKLESELKLL